MSMRQKVSHDDWWIPNQWERQTETARSTETMKERETFMTMTIENPIYRINSHFIIVIVIEHFLWKKKRFAITEVASYIWHFVWNEKFLHSIICHQSKFVITFQIWTTKLTIAPYIGKCKTKFKAKCQIERMLNNNKCNV